MRAKVTLAPSLRGTSLASALAAPERLLASPGAHVVKKHRRAVVARIPIDGRDVFVKRFKPYAWYRRLEAALGMGAARRSWRSALDLGRSGFSVPPPLAFVELSRLGVPGDSYFVSEAVPAAEPAADYWRREAHRIAPAERRRILRAAAALLRRLHDSGLYSRDTNANNFLIRARPGARIEFFLVDLENVRRLRSVGRRRRVKNLVQLYRFFRGTLSRSDLLRFMLAYRGRPGALRSDGPERQELRRWLGDLRRMDERKEREYRRRRAFRPPPPR